MMVEPIRVMLDARMLLGRFSGVARMVTRLAEELAKRDDVRVVALCGNEDYEPWRGRRDITVVASDFTRRDRTPMRRRIWEERRLRRLICEAGVDLFHATWNSGIPWRCPVPGVLTIHDLIPWNEPVCGLGQRVERGCYRSAVRIAARRAVRITTVSDYVRRDVIRRLRVDPRRIEVIGNGVDPALHIPERRGQAPTLQPELQAPYVLYVGGHERRKNVAGVLAAMQTYWARSGFGLELHLTGSLEQLCPEAAAVLNRTDPEAPVRFLGDPDDGQLSRLYGGATALLLLSYEEGFGLPALEAMVHGCPVIASNRMSLPEVVGDAGLLVAPDDQEAAARAIRDLVESPQVRAGLLERGRARAASALWRDVAERMVCLYRGVLNPRPKAESAFSESSPRQPLPALSY